MQILSRSAIAAVEQARREKDEYCDYVESWIHELKMPLTACSLILANDGDVRKLKRELKRADNLTENILYYARLRSVEHDTQIGKLQVAAVMDAAVKSQMELLIAAGISVEVDGDFCCAYRWKIVGVYAQAAANQLCQILSRLSDSDARRAGRADGRGRWLRHSSA